MTNPIYEWRDVDAIDLEGLQEQINERGREIGRVIRDALFQTLTLNDGVPIPATRKDVAIIYIDSADGDLKIKFADGTVKTIVIDT